MRCRELLSRSDSCAVHYRSPDSNSVYFNTGVYTSRSAATRSAACVKGPLNLSAVLRKLQASTLVFYSESLNYVVADKTLALTMIYILTVEDAVRRH